MPGEDGNNKSKIVKIYKYSAKVYILYTIMNEKEYVICYSCINEMKGGKRVVMKTLKSRKTAVPYLMLLPTLALIAVFMLYPMMDTVWLSFQNYSMIDAKNASFAGLDNFKALAEDRIFLKAVKHSVAWIFENIIPQLVLGMGVALLLNQKFKGRAVARALIFTPWAVGGMITALIFRFLFNGSVGVFGDILLRLGITSQRAAWFSNAQSALATMIVANTWRGVPFFAISILAALQNISDEIYESAEVDGANSFVKFYKITLPMIKDTLVLTTLLRTIWTLNIVDIIYSMTNGGPNNSTITLPVYIMQKFTDTLNSGYCSAMAVCMVVALVIFAMLYLKLSNYGKESLY